MIDTLLTCLVIGSFFALLVCIVIDLIREWRNGDIN